MKATSEWVSVNDALPGLDTPVLVFNAKTSRIVGPVRLKEDEPGHTLRGPLGGELLPVPKPNAWPLFWSKDGMDFTEFMPTHWASIPDPPKQSEPEQ